MRTSKYFMIALKSVLESGEIKQVDIARKTGIAPQTISNIVRNDKAPGLPSQEQISTACGYTHFDFIQIGKTLDEGGDIQTITGNRNQTANRNSRIVTVAPKGPKLSPEIQTLVNALERLPEDERIQKIYKILGELAEQ